MTIFKKKATDIQETKKLPILVRGRREIYRQIKYFRDEKATRRF